MPTKKAEPYIPLARDAAQQHGVPLDLLLGLLEQESGFNPSAVSKDDKGNPVAYGIAQIIPTTAKALGVDPLNPEQAIGGSAKYLRQLFDQFGDWDSALYAYHAGPDTVKKYKAGKRKLGPKTRAYLPAVKTNAKKYASFVSTPDGAVQDTNVAIDLPGRGSGSVFLDRISFGRAMPATQKKKETVSAITTPKGITIAETPEEGFIVDSAKTKGYSPKQQEQLIAAMQTILPARNLIEQRKELVPGATMPDELDTIIKQLIRQV